MSESADSPDRRQRDRRNIDRRRTQRHYLDADIRFLRAGGAPHEILEGELLDVSRTGLRLALRNALVPDDRLLIEVRDQARACFNLTAVVVWVEPHAPGGVLVGCELCVDLSPKQHARLKQLAFGTRSP